MRIDGRLFNQLRPVKITPHFNKHAEGSCLIEAGETKVICTASFEEKVPPFLVGKGTGWVTAEYGMIPRSTNTRMERGKILNTGRTLEIQRLIGRSLRGVVDVAKMGERSIKVDCDVIQADGGTRTASITGGFIALALAFQKLQKNGILKENPITDTVAAVSVGKYGENLLLDLCYEEDSNAETDMNVVMVGNGDFVEVQATAEGKPFSQKEMDQLLGLAVKGIRELMEIQKQYVGSGK